LTGIRYWYIDHSGQKRSLLFMNCRLCIRSVHTDDELEFDAFNFLAADTVERVKFSSVASVFWA